MYHVRRLRNKTGVSREEAIMLYLEEGREGVLGYSGFYGVYHFMVRFLISFFI